MTGTHSGPLAVSVIGLGMAAEPHALALRDLVERVRVVHAATRSVGRGQAFAARHGFPVTADIDAAITDPVVDAVIVLTPPNTHAVIAEAALHAGKHVLIEKPLDASLPAAEGIVATAGRLGLRAGVVLQHRFRPAAQRLRAMIDDGALGAIQAAHLHVAWWRPQSYYDEPGRGTLARDGGGVLMTQAIHAIDLMRSLVGPMTVAHAMARTTALHRMEVEDHVVALLRLPNGAPASIVATTAAAPGFPETLDLIGTRATARLTAGQLDVAYVDGRREQVVADTRSGAGAGPMDFTHDAHRALIADFADAIRDDRSPLCSAHDALETQRLIAAMLAG
ncbi:Gfo/Idh/MocA family protein [Sphingomonas floccifaciens]|uniref:Gfo/Idh/MocA family protein n=1 Tax=Sphingomonas floccifaciens TaxID=1844115 RepID=A0ABW4N841_9SPHN